MSLIQMFGTHKNDLDRIIRNEQELMKLAAAPLMIYRIKERLAQTSSDDFYGEITKKGYYRPIELRGFWANPTLVQELVKMGLDMPETITIYFDIEAMNGCLGRELAIGDIIRPYHQRNQYYVVMNSVPNQMSERLYKYTQWMVTVEKLALTGFSIPDYLVLNHVTSWITFGEHYMTSQLMDRERHLEDREYKICGDLEYFWNESTFFDLCGEGEAGNFNGIDNYLDFGNNYNFGTDNFTISLFLKPEEIDRTQCIIKKGDDLSIKILDGGQVEVTLNENIFTTTSPVFDNPNVWTQVALIVYYPERFVGIYKNGVRSIITPAQLDSTAPLNITNEEPFLVGIGSRMEQLSNKSGTGCNNCDGEESGMESETPGCIYKGLMSNLRIYSVALEDDEILNDYQSLITRKFINL